MIRMPNMLESSVRQIRKITALCLSLNAVQYLPNTYGKRWMKKVLLNEFEAHGNSKTGRLMKVGGI